MASTKLLREIEESQPPKRSALIWFLGGASLAVRFHKQQLIFIDLDYKAGREPVKVPADGPLPGFTLIRNSLLPIDPSKLGSKAAYLSTHEHIDHCDRSAALAVARRGGIFIGPRSSCELARSWGVRARQVRSLDGENFEMTKVGQVEVWATPNTDPTAVSTDGFILRCDGVSVFHNGDGHYDGRKNLDIASKFKIDVAIINLGRNVRGRKWYHTPCEVAQAANDLRPRYLLAHHYDKWDVAVEDPSRVEQAVKDTYPDLLKKMRCVVLKVGEKLKVSASR